MSRHTRSRKHMKKGGMSCYAGGSKSRRHHKRGGARKTARRHVKKGGMMTTLSGMVQTALVPFGLYGAQKFVQRGKKSEKREHR